MLNRPTHIPTNDSLYIRPTKFNQNQHNQHGSPDNRILLSVPSETLTGITSYLNPPSLLSLATVHSRLDAHVKNDNTWHRAFVCQFLGIGPENEIHDDVKSLMLRRSENTWRNEFIVRYKLRRRWERSRNATVTHIPVFSEISNMHMMAGSALLTSSIKYGIVSRSLPLTGKILQGYLDATGLRQGLGVGNPNAEFSPDVSICTLSSDGGTAKVIWGFRHGEVGVMAAPRAIDASRRPVTEMVRCEINYQHAGAVLDAAWDGGPGTVVVTAGADGIVKMWDAKTVHCIWASERKPGFLIPDPCIKVAASAAQGIVATVTRSGEIVLWTGFKLQSSDELNTDLTQELRISCPIDPPESTPDVITVAPNVVSALHIDPYSTSILVAYEDHPYIYRLKIIHSGSVDIAAFGDASFGPIATLLPSFSPEGSSFILAGDHIGCVSVYDWNAPSNPTSTSIHCVRKFEAHEDGAGVTALAWNGVTLITGSARGNTTIWDGLTFEHLRSFASPVPRVRGRGPGAHHGGREREPVRQILIGPEKEVMMVRVGDRVMAWMAGPVPRTISGGVRGRNSSGTPKKKKDKQMGKYLEQVELHETISESKSLLKQEAEDVQRRHGRERDQRARLEKLGLDEGEAIQYLLMLSRDEALQRGSVAMNPEEGVFEGDFDFDNGSSHPTTNSGTVGAHSPCAHTPLNQSGINTPKLGQAKMRFSPSTSNEKIYVSPPRPEPVAIDVGHSTSSSPLPQSPDSANETLFPSISAGSSPSPSLTSRRYLGRDTNSPSLAPASWSTSQGGSGRSSDSMPGSPQSIRSASVSAWNIPLKKSASGRSLASSASSVSVTSSARSHRSLGLREDEMDEELRFAIELSLAEARSRGEVV